MSSTLTWRPAGPNEVEAEASRYQNIDGPQINALQVISEALDIPQDEHDDDNSQIGVEDGALTSSNASFTFGSRTVVAADNEVSNGFVKSGRSLPYVFEANESGKCSFLTADWLHYQASQQIIDSSKNCFLKVFMSLM